MQPATNPEPFVPSDGLVARRPRFTRAQKTTIVYGVLSIVLVLVVIQLWLLAATMNAFLGGDEAVILPAALASLVCLLLNLGLLVYIYKLDRSQ